MPLKSELMAVGMPAAHANRLGLDPITNFTAAGTTQATATVLSANNANVTTSSVSGGVILASGEVDYSVYNAGPSVLQIYPVVGIAFGGIAANSPIQVAAGGTAQIAGGGPTGAAWTVT
jgi:hypothetical protein